MNNTCARWVAVTGLAVLTAAGCGRRNTGNSLTIKGSDTMVILGQRWAEAYMKAHPNLVIQVTGGGSGTGIAALINGGTDICQASRPMKPEEFAQVKERRGVEAKEIAVAIDGIALYVHEHSTLRSLTLDQIKGIFQAKITDWKALGAEKGTIVPYGRENSSGTYAYFKEHVLKTEDFAASVQSLPGTAAVVNAVAKDPRAIGYGGIAYAKGVRPLKISAAKGKPALEPTKELVTSGKYPISRKLFFYTAGEPQGAAAAFVAWVRSAEGQQVCAEVGYFP
ncbi:MAG: phosphate ABC transporter substrate-binding protein, partial [bacterium]